MEDFFSLLFAGIKAKERIELRHQPNPASKTMKAHFVHSPSEATAATATLGTGHLYVGVAPRGAKGGGSKRNVSRLLSLWIDVDATREPPPFALPPSLVVDSGNGYHYYWLLTEALGPDDFEAAEGWMTQAATLLGGDTKVHDVARILRVPGTTNFKDPQHPKPCNLVTAEDNRYTWGDLQAALAIPVEIHHAVNTSGNSGHRSRSERDWAVVTAMLSAGVSVDTTTQVFAVAPCGNKMREGGNYWEHTLKRATARAAKTAGGGAACVAGPFVMENDQYFVLLRGDKVPVSTFTFEPQALIEHTDAHAVDALLGVLHASGFVWPSQVLTKIAFNSVSDLNRQMPQAAAQWLGSDRQLRALLPYLMQQLLAKGLPKIQATRVLGRFENYWVGTDQVLSAAEITEGDARPVHYMSAQREAPHTHYATVEPTVVKALARQLFPLLWQLNRPEVMGPVLGWLFSAPFKPLLWDLNVRYPLLNIFGTRGSGKTVTITRVLLPLLGVVDGRSYDSGTTNFVLLTLLGATNALPVSLSEFRLHSTPRLLRYLLLAYDSGRDARGRADQTTQEYPLTSPLIVDGEDALVDPALKERVLQVRLMPETIDLGTPAEKAHRQIDTLGINRIAAAYIQYTLQAPLKWTEALRSIQDAFANQPMPDRVRQNLAIGVHGLIHLALWLESLGLRQPLLTPEYVRSLFEETLFNVVEKSGRTSLLADEFIEALVNDMATNDHPRYVAAWFPREAAMGFQISSAYTWWATERRRAGRDALELPALKAQLQERLIDPRKPQVGQYILCRTAVTLKGATYWMYKVSLEEARRADLDLPDKLPLATEIVISNAGTGGKNESDRTH